MESKIVQKIRTDIIGATQNRCGRWVSESFLHIVGSKNCTPNITFAPILKSLIEEGVLEKSYVPVQGKHNKIIQLPLYRMISKH